MFKKGMLLSGLLSALGLAACNPSEFFVDVSNIGSDVDELDVYVATQAMTGGPWMVSQRISVNDAMTVAAKSSGHYTLSLDHSLPLSSPGQAQVFVGALAAGCLRSVGSASGELKTNNSGYSSFSIPLAAAMPPNESTPCVATQPKVTNLELSRVVASDGTVSTDGLLYGWGFASGAEAHIVITTANGSDFGAVDDTLSSAEYFPDHVRFSLASVSPAKVSSILSPSTTLTKTVQGINPGPPAVTSNLFPFK